MWNDHVKASVPPNKDWMVPVFFLLLAAAGAFSLGYTVATG